MGIDCVQSATGGDPSSYPHSAVEGSLFLGWQQAWSCSEWTQTRNTEWGCECFSKVYREDRKLVYTAGKLVESDFLTCGTALKAIEWGMAHLDASPTEDRTSSYRNNFREQSFENLGSVQSVWITQTLTSKSVECSPWRNTRLRVSFWSTAFLSNC